MRKIFFTVLFNFATFISFADNLVQQPTNSLIQFKINKETCEFYNPVDNQSFFVIQHEGLTADELMKSYWLNCIHTYYVYPYLDKHGILNSRLSFKNQDSGILKCRAFIKREHVDINCGVDYGFSILFTFQFKDGRVRIDAVLDEVQYGVYIRESNTYSQLTSFKYKEDWFLQRFSIYDGQSAMEKRVTSVEKAANDYINSFLSQLFHPSVTDWENAITWDEHMFDNQIIKIVPGEKMQYTITDKDYINIKIDGYSNHNQATEAYISSLRDLESAFKKVFRNLDVRFDVFFFEQYDNFSSASYDGMRVVHIVPNTVEGLRLLDMDYCVIFKDDIIKVYPPRFYGYKTKLLYKKDGSMLDGRRQNEDRSFNEKFYQDFVFTPLIYMWQKKHPQVKLEEAW